MQLETFLPQVVEQINDRFEAHQDSRFGYLETGPHQADVPSAPQARGSYAPRATREVKQRAVDSVKKAGMLQAEVCSKFGVNPHTLRLWLRTIEPTPKEPVGRLWHDIVDVHAIIDAREWDRDHPGQFERDNPGCRKPTPAECAAAEFDGDIELMEALAADIDAGRYTGADTIYVEYGPHHHEDVYGLILQDADGTRVTDPCMLKRLGRYLVLCAEERMAELGIEGGAETITYDSNSRNWEW